MRAAPAAPAWPAFRKLRVTKVVRESENVSSLYLTAADGAALPAACAGQYLTLRVSGAGQPAPVRSYSLSSDPDRRDLPDQRQAGTPRRRERLPEPGTAGGSGP